MNRFLFIPVLLVFLLVPPAVRAQDPTLAGAQENPIPLDSVFGDLHGYLTLHTPDALHLFVRTSIRDWLAEQQRLSEAGLAASQRALLRKTLAMSTNDGVVHYTPLGSVVAEATTRRDTVSYLPLPVKRDTAQKEILPGVLAQYADLGIAVHGDGQLGGAWRAYKPCDVALTLQCKAGVVPQLTPDMTFGVRVAGTVAERIHVNVNFDQKNEFDATNNLNVSYQGLPDEVFQSLDVGDVSIRLPASRYLTRGIPAGNFGLRATGQVGPLDFQTVYAQQKGDLSKRSFEIAGAGSTQSVVQQQHLVTDDADYVQGQFFYLVDPALIRGAPYFDPLALRASDAPVSVRPRTNGVIALYRDERLSATAGVGNAELGRFLANAVPATGSDEHSGTFRRLTPDVDYVVHSSGLWITLKSPLRTDEALAMAYVTESGDTIGDINAEQSPAGTTPLLRLLRGPVSKHQPGSATWNYEMHDVYRLDNSAGVDLTSIDMKISLGDVAGGKTFQTVNGTQVTYMKFFGLDEDAPTDRVDEAQIYQPSRGAFGSATTVTVPGTFVVLPGLQPFFDPAPVSSANLSSADLKAALGANANNTIYNEVDPVNRANGARFKLNFDYRVQADGLVSSFALGAIGIRDGSERIMLGTQQLQKGADYDIDYDVGQLTLRDPATLFATHPGAKLTATWEQKPMFEVAPTSVFGMNTRYTIGHRGQLDFVGLLQNERSLMARPQLGTEPGAVFLGGMSGGLDLGGGLLDQVFSKVPGLRLGSPSRAHLTAELAMSSPNPNTKGAAYLEDFEATDELRVDPRRQNWQLGSKPENNTGDLGTLPFVLNATNAAPMTWTHDFKDENGSIGGSYKPTEFFDDSIKVVGNETPEYTMRLDFGKAGVVGKQQWRSITTVLSTTGMDLSHSEYMEMYVAAGDKEPLALIFDLGNVSEDAFYVDSLGNTTGNYPDGTQTKWGLGTLDEEARLAQREVWGTGPGSPDARGLWNQDCQATPGEVYVVRDPRTNCTRNNGVRNTEDLDGNGVLDAHDGAYFRYVITLDQLSQYLVRSKEQTGTAYQLYRIPLRNGAPIGGANESTWRFIKQLRLTVAGTPTLSGIRTVQIARMRIVGSQWIKRDTTGSSSGALSDQPGRGAEVHVSPISRLTDSQYSSPGSVNTGVQDPSKTIGAGGVENNEKSLSISYDRLLPGDRAEVYYRYPQQARSFMNYRTLRLWALPRAGTWGVPSGERFLVKVGTDARNFYLFQTTLRPAGPSASNWLPELEIDFSKWFALKDSAEKKLIERPPTAGGQDTVWSADSAYAIVLEDRARAPNLDQIRELSFAVYNAGSGSATGEVWIDDVTLTGAERSIGRAAALTLDMNVGDFINGSVSLSHQDDVFRQLNENATYIAAGDVSFNATAQLDRLLPPSLGIYLPVTVTHVGSGQDPTFLASTDVLAQGLGSLRETGAGNTTVAVVLSKRTPTANPFLSAIIDGTALRFNYASASNRQITSKAETGSLNAGLSYNHPIIKKSFDVVPMFMENFLRAIVPVKVEHSDAFKRLVNSHLRFLPDGISFNTGYSNQIARTYNYDRILTLPEDSLIRPIESPRQGLQNDARLSLAPFNGLTASIAAGSVRDLLDPTRATQDPRVQAALQKARGGIGGLDLGWETNRNIRSNFAYSPQISSWITADYNYENVYTTDRSPSYLGSFQDDSSSALGLQRRFESARTTTRRLRLRPGDFALAAFGAAPKKLVGFDRIRRGVLNRFDVIELTWNTTLSSQFERENQLPDLGYQLGLGNLSSFHLVNNDTAARALQTNEFRTTAGIPLSKVTRFDVSYGTTDLHSLDQRGGERLQNERSWPRVQVNMHDIPLPEKWHKLLVNATVSGGVSRVVTTNVFGGTTAQDRSTTKFDIPVSTTLTFAHGVSMTYTGSFSTGKSLDPTGRRETVNGSQQLRFNSFFGAPTFVSSKFTQPLATSLTLTQRSSTQCGASALLLVTDCTRQINTVIRTGRFEASTNVDQMRVGVSLDYNGTQNYVGIQNGQSQLQFSIFGSFILNAGTMPSEFGGIH